jgi:hypothetical protein
LKELAKIKDLGGYLESFGDALARKVIDGFAPLHVPEKDPVPPFDYIPPNRKPFPAQADMVAAMSKALDEQNSVFFIGEPGCGKSLTSILSVHEHAMKKFGGRYRAIILCPDDLIYKWAEQEIKPTIPDAKVFAYKKWWDFLDLMDLGHKEVRKIQGPKPASVRESPVSTGPGPHFDENREFQDKEYEFECRPETHNGSMVTHRVGRWKPPEGPEWWIIGRDLAKRTSQTEGLGQKKAFGLTGAERTNATGRWRVMDHQDVLDERGEPVKVWDEKCGWRTKKKPVMEKLAACPRCGTFIMDDKGKPMPLKKLDSNYKCCEAVYLEELPDEGVTCSGGLDRISLLGEPNPKHKAGARPQIPGEIRKSRVGSIVKHAGKRWVVKKCGEPLYQYTNKPWWWSPALLIQRKMKRLFKYIVVDEAHQQKSEESEQSLAFGKILAATRYCVGLTGTFLNGYASSIFTLLWRTRPADLIARGFDWGDADKDWTERYGCFDEIKRYKTTVGAHEGNGKKHGLKSAGSAKLGDFKTEFKPRPGIMPALFSEQVIGAATFLKLDDFVEGLPDLVPNVVAVELPGDVKMAYRSLEQTLKDANAALVMHGNRKLLATMLWTLLAYPDRPWDWIPMFPKDKEHPLDSHAVGWWMIPNHYVRNNFVGVATPENFSKDLVLPKEKALIDLCVKYRDMGDQTWVGCLLTGKHDVLGRLQKVLTDHGLRVGVLRAGDVPPRERSQWLEAHAGNFEVMLSNTSVIATGRDLFCPSGNGNYKFNFNHLIAYETGYVLTILRQFEGRSRRIGQTRECTIDYLYYAGTAQAAALMLMGNKDRAAQVLESGRVGDSGIASMGDSGSDDLMLLKLLGESIDPELIKRNWTKIKAGGKKKAAVVVEEPPPGPPVVVVPEKSDDETIEEAMAELRQIVEEKPKVYAPPKEPTIHCPGNGGVFGEDLDALFKAIRASVESDVWDF